MHTDPNQYDLLNRGQQRVALLSSIEYRQLAEKPSSAMRYIHSNALVETKEEVADGPFQSETNTKNTLYLTGKDSVRDSVLVTGSYQPVPRVNFDPGSEYADKNRHFGIASSITRTPGGRLWVGFVSGGTEESKENYGIIVTSDDGGATWTPPRIVLGPDDPDKGEELIRSDHVTVWTAPNGHLWIMWSEYPEGLSGPHSSQWAIVSPNPDADDPEWSAPRKLVDEQNLLTKPTVLSDGTWIFPTGNWQRGYVENGELIYPDDDRNRPYASRPLISKNSGRTFHLGGPLRLEGIKDPDFDEYMIIERSDEGLVLFNRYFGTFLQAESSDQGETWTLQQPNDIPHVNARFVFMKLHSGNWLLVKHGTMDWVSDQEQARGPNRGRSHLTAFISRDEGKTWEGGLMLDKRLSSYPFGFQDQDGTVYVSYERNRWNQPEILIARFTEEDVLAGKPVSDIAGFRILVNKATGSPPLQKGD